MKKVILPSLLVALSLAACTNDSDETLITPKYPTVSEITLSRSEQFANDGLNKFGIDFYAATTKCSNYDDLQNYVISPVSLTLAHSIWANMNSDQPANEIAGWFDCEDISTLNSLSNKLMRFLPDKVNNNEMALANSVWHRPGIEPTADFIDRMSTYFYADVISADFDSPNIRKTISDWFVNNTRGMIQDVSIPFKQSKVVFANALYFKSDWGVKFEKSQTQKETFHSPFGDRDVMMMHTEANMKHYNGSDFDMLTIPYDGNNEFLAILPKEGADFKAFAQSLDYDAVQNAIEHSAVKAIQLSMPRFETQTSSLDCGMIRQQMGFETPDENFTGIVGTDLGSSVTITHYAKIVTNEDGTEASAVTVGFEWGAKPGIEPAKKVFTLDRPFIYLIRNTVTGSIIMIGQYVQP